MKKILLFVFLFSSISLFADCTNGNILTNVRPENGRFLINLAYQNFFGEAYVACDMEEFRVNTGNSTQHICFKLGSNLYEGLKMRGDSVPGIDNKLSSISSTESFTYPKGSNLEYFCRMGTFVGCGDTEDPPTPHYDSKGNLIDQAQILPPEDIRWLIGKGKIKDNTSWTIHLCDSLTGEVLATIDSCGVNQNPNSDYAQKFGKEPNKFNHSYTLPDNFAGRHVYINIVVRREGQTPYGVDLFVRALPFSIADLLENNGSLLDEKCPEYTDEVLDNYYYNQVIQYCDSVKNATGWLPPNTYTFSFSQDSNSKKFFNRYYKEITISGTSKPVWVEKGSAFADSKIATAEGTTALATQDEFIILNVVYVNKLNEYPKGIEYYSSKEIDNATADFYDINAKLQSSVPCKITKGRCQIFFDKTLADLSSGVYIIAFKDHNKLLGTTKICR